MAAKSTAKPAAKVKANTAKKASAPRAPRVSAKSVRRALVDLGGNISAVAAAFSVSRQTVYNWIARYALNDLVEVSRDTMFATAEKNINLAVMAGNLEASKFVLTHMPVAERWSSRSEVKTEFDLPVEVMDVLKAAGVDVKQVLVELANIAKERGDQHG